MTNKKNLIGKASVIGLLIAMMVMFSACSADNTDQDSSSAQEESKKAGIVTVKPDEEALGYFFEDEYYAVYKYTAPEDAESITIDMDRYVKGKKKSSDLVMEEVLTDERGRFRTGTISICMFEPEMIQIRLMSGDGTAVRTMTEKFASPAIETEGTEYWKNDFPDRDCEIGTDLPLYMTVCDTDNEAAGLDRESIEKAEWINAVVLRFN